MTSKKITEIFQRSALHQTALWTLTSELQRKKLIWSKSKKETGRNIELFASDIIKSFMAFGYAVWKTSRSGRLLVADPAICTVERTKSGRWKVLTVADPTLSGRGWHCTTFVTPPLHVKHPEPHEWPSPTVLSYVHYLRVVEIEENWMRRDTHNSYPSVFTTIALDHFSKDKEINNDPGSHFIYSTLPKPSQYRSADSIEDLAFQTTNISDGAGGVTPVHSSSFQEIAKSRYDAVRKLGQQSTLEREAILAGRNNGMAWDPQLLQKESPQLHEEHIINDGKKAVETKILLSTVDARLQYDRTRHAVLFALGVPPQAVGETVNSERTASSAAIYDVAIGLFLRTVEQYRVAVTSVLKEATMLDNGDHVIYSTGVSGIQLTRVMPLVKTSVAVQLLSQSYNLPTSFFDPARVAAMQSAEQPAKGKGPQAQLETVAATPSQRGVNAAG